MTLEEHKDKIEDLGKKLGDQLIDSLKEYAKNVADDQKEFLVDLGKKMAKNHFEVKFGSEERKKIAIENLEYLKIAFDSNAAIQQLEFYEYGKEQVSNTVKTIVKTLITIGLSLV